MKIKTDFITNSSTSSFVIMAKEFLNKYQLKEELEKNVEIPTDFILPKLGIRIADILSDNIDETMDIYKYIEDVAYGEDIEDLGNSDNKMDGTVYKNYKEYPYIMFGSVTNESDEPLEVLLTDEDIYFKNDRIILVKNGGY
jgi:hypothetical protein